MVSNEEEMKTEEALLAEEVPANGAENGAEVAKPAVAEAVVAAKDPMEEEHTTLFPSHPETFFAELVNLRLDTAFNDGSLVVISNGKRKRFPVLMSSFSIGSIKLNREFLKAKRTMMESGYMNNTIDLLIPDFAQPDQSAPETAFRAVQKYIYTGTLDVSDQSIKNITVLSAFLGIDPILEKLPELASQLGFDEFPFEELSNTGKGLGEMKVVGLDKFIAAGFGNKPKPAAEKRKNPKKVVNAPPAKKPKEEPVVAAAVPVVAAAPAANGDAPAEAVEEDTPMEEAVTVEQAEADAPEPASEETPEEPAPVDSTEAETPEPEAEPVAKPAARGRGKGKRGRGRGK